MARSIRNLGYTNLRERLIQAREDAGITQADLAARLGRTQSFVSKYEQGERRLDVIDFVLVCHHLSISPSDLLSSLKASLLSGHKA